MKVKAEKDLKALNDKNALDLSNLKKTNEKLQFDLIKAQSNQNIDQSLLEIQGILQLDNDDLKNQLNASRMQF